MMIDPAEVIWRFQQQTPVDLRGAAATLGIPVVYESLPDKIAGKIERVSDRPTRFKITINAEHHPNRQRFTLAHELAHYVMHRDLIKTGIVDTIMYRSEMSSYYEIQANRRAEEFLMPADLMRNEWNSTPFVAAMASKFGVSQESMKIRIKNLGLKPPKIENPLFG